MAEAGVVDQQGDRPGPVGQPSLHPAQRLPVGEVRGEHLDLDAVLRPELLGELAQPLLVAGHEDEVVAARGELVGERAADPGSGTGDEGGSA